MNNFESSDITELIHTYKEMFGECFPTMHFMGACDEMIRELTRCIENNTRFIDDELEEKVY